MNKFYSITPTNHGWGFGYGFFSNYRICLEHLIDHHENGDGSIPYIDWSKTTFVEGFNPFESTNNIPDGNPFDQWFDQIIPQKNDIVIRCTRKSDDNKYHHAKHYFDEPEQLKIHQTVDKLYIKPKKYILDKIDEIYEKELKGHVVLGVMARGTEYNFHHPMYGVFEINDYIEEIKKILDANPQITKLFLASEDMEYIDALHKSFPNSYFVPDVFRRTDETMEYVNRVHCWPNVSTKRDNQCKLLGEETIIQTKLLGKCDYLFGRFSGIFAGAVLWNDNFKKVFKI
jgi:hypothetical protein